MEGRTGTGRTGMPHSHRNSPSSHHLLLSLPPPPHHISSSSVGGREVEKETGGEGGRKGRWWRGGGWGKDSVAMERAWADSLTPRACIPAPPELPSALLCLPAHLCVPASPPWACLVLGFPACLGWACSLLPPGQGGLVPCPSCSDMPGALVQFPATWNFLPVFFLYPWNTSPPPRALPHHPCLRHSHIMSHQRTLPFYLLPNILFFHFHSQEAVGILRLNQCSHPSIKPLYSLFLFAAHSSICAMA